MPHPWALPEPALSTEGRPIQVTQSYSKRTTTIFEKGEGAPGAPPPLDGVTPLEEMRWPPGSEPVREVIQGH